MPINQNILTRRRLLKLLLMAYCASMMPPVLGRKSQLLKGKYIIVIGAGISGLTAASELIQKGANVTILEANNYIGGRIKTDWSLGKDAPFEVGAGWIHGPSQDNPTKQLADKSGCKYFLTNDNNISTFDSDGTIWSDEKFEAVEEKWEKALYLVDEELELNDRRSLRKAIQDIYPAVLNDPGGLWALSAYTEFDKGTSIEKVSAVFHDDDKAFDKPDVIITNGYDSIIKKLSKNLDIRLNNKVSEIDISNKDFVRVQSNDKELKCDSIICSVPLGILKAKNIKFKPSLPKKYIKSIDKLGFGSVTKIAMKFNDVFWDKETQYFGVNTEIKGRWNYWLNYRTFSRENILLGLSVGDYALIADQMNEKEMKNDAMIVLRDVWGQNIPDPSDILTTRWSKEENILGAYSYPSPGSTPRDYKVLSTPVDGKLFFCGEHTNFDYSATTHGAYLSGIRVVKDIEKAILN